ncbi:MAG: DinB family protein [Bacteroidetes bacterium]|nr:DinB family protein [Bacteroidota bacterium]
MKILQHLLQDIESKIPKHEMLNPSVSQVSVGWHIEHILITMNAILVALKRSNPSEFKRSLQLSRVIVFTFQRIPRGRAKAPTRVMPGNYTTESLHKHIALTKTNLDELQNMPSNHYFNHPYFGDLKLKQAIQFLKIHTKHHLKIIEDILRS